MKPGRRGLAHARKALAGRRGPARSADLTLLPMTFADVVEAAGTSLPNLPRLTVPDLRGPAAREAVDALAPYLADIRPAVGVLPADRRLPPGGELVVVHR